MSWFTNLTNHAENFLNILDESAAVALKSPTNSSQFHSSNLRNQINDVCRDDFITNLADYSMDEMNNPSKIDYT